MQLGTPDMIGKFKVHKIKGRGLFFVYNLPSKYKVDHMINKSFFLNVFYLTQTSNKQISALPYTIPCTLGER